MTLTKSQSNSKKFAPTTAERNAAATNKLPQSKGKKQLKATRNIVDFLRQLHPSEIFEIRILGKIDPTTGKRRISSGYFDCPEKAAKCIRAEERNRPSGIYCTLNEIDPELFHRSPNRITASATQATKDEDVLRRKWLLVDIDPRRNAQISSTQSELDKASDKSNKIRLFLDKLGWAAPIHMMSGNGFCLLYPIDLPNDQQAEDLVKAVLHTLASNFDDEFVKIDPVVCDAPRIVKVGGTKARKGANLTNLGIEQDRPHRRSFWCPPTSKGVVSDEMLEALLAFEKSTTDNSKSIKKSAPDGISSQVRRQSSAATENHVGANVDFLCDIPDVLDNVMERCRRYVDKMTSAIEGQHGSNDTFHVACVLARFGLSKRQAMTLFTEYSDRCIPPWSARELDHKLVDAYKKVRSEGEFGSFATGTADGDQVFFERTTLKSESANDVAVAFVESLRDESGCLTIRRWRQAAFLWRQGRYVEIKEDELRSRLVAYLQQRYTHVKAVLINDILANVRPLIEIESLIEPPCVLTECGSELIQWQTKDIYVGPSQIVHLPSIFDVEGFKAVPNTPNYFSMVANGCDLCVSAKTPGRWLQFLDQIFNGDKKAVLLLQQWMGYLLTQDTRRQKIMLLQGPARSGKGTIGRVIQAIAGPDSCCSPTLADLSGQFGLSVLLGKSVAIIGDARLNAREHGGTLVERLLSISGEDSIAVNRKYRDLLTTRLTTRFTIMSNELPRFDDASGVIASRFLILTTKQSFLGSEDLDLTDDLLEEKEAMLWWAMQGWQSLNDTGRFVQTHDTIKAQAEMRRIASPVLHFVEDQCELAPEAMTPKDDLYYQYRQWCSRNGFDKHAKTLPIFAKDLVACCPNVSAVRARVRGTEDRVHRWKGICLKR